MNSIRLISLLLLTVSFGCKSEQSSDMVRSSTVPRSAERDADLDWRTFANQYFECQLPVNWELNGMKKRGNAEVSFDVIQPDATIAFTITVAIDRPRFIECYCTGWGAYHFYTRDDTEYANVYLGDGKWNTRTLKAKGARFGTDVHLAYGELDRPTADRIAESVCPH